MKVEAEKGFSLIELLVVTAIIGILASLVLTAVGVAKRKATRIVCQNGLRQISLGVRMYADDSNDRSPKPAARMSNPYSAYKALMKSYVGQRGQSPEKNKLFACPSDTYYFDYVFGSFPRSTNMAGFVSKRICDREDFDFSSYLFNGGNAFGPTNRPGIAGLPMSSIKHPTRTVLLAEAPAVAPFSWHKPKRPLYLFTSGNCRNFIFNNAMNMVSYVDGHVSFVQIHWSGATGPLGVACNYDPPDGYDYQWSPN